MELEKKYVPVTVHFDATWLCYIVGSKDDSVTGLRITADCHRLLTQFRAPLTFHRCIKCVHVYV